MAEQFKPGDQVKVRSNIATGHHRTPAFVQGKTGAIELIHGTFGNPDKGGQAEPRQPLYLVSFAQTHIWQSCACFLFLHILPVCPLNGPHKIC